MTKHIAATWWKITAAIALVLLVVMACGEDDPTINGYIPDEAVQRLKVALKQKTITPGTNVLVDCGSLVASLAEETTATGTERCRVDRVTNCLDLHGGERAYLNVRKEAVGRGIERFVVFLSPINRDEGAASTRAGGLWHVYPPDGDEGWRATLSFSNAPDNQSCAVPVL